MGPFARVCGPALFVGLVVLGLRLLLLLRLLLRGSRIGRLPGWRTVQILPGVVPAAWAVIDPSARFRSGGVYLKDKVGLPAAPRAGWSVVSSHHGSAPHQVTLQ